MVPVKEAINSGAWLQCEYDYDGKIIKFRLKVNSFRKINLLKVDNPEEIDGIDSNSVIWLLQIEVINLNKTPLEVYNATAKLTLIDQDGFVFPFFEDSHLHSSSKFSKKNGLQRFYNDDLLPKIKALGSITFQLPDDDEAEYSIGLEDNGIVQEV